VEKLARPTAGRPFRRWSVTLPSAGARGPSGLVPVPGTGCCEDVAARVVELRFEPAASGVAS
jgi:hypothetical protein